MAKDLSGLIRLRKYEVDEHRRALGLLFRREAALNAEEDALDTEFAREEAFLAENPALGFTLGPYVTRFTQEKDAIAARRERLHREIAAAQDTLAEAYRALKSLEVTQENRQKREAQEQERKDQAVLDEIGLTMFRRRGDSGSADASDSVGVGRPDSGTPPVV